MRKHQVDPDHVTLPGGTMKVTIRHPDHDGWLLMSGIDRMIPFVEAVLTDLRKQDARWQFSIERPAVKVTL